MEWSQLSQETFDKKLKETIIKKEDSKNFVYLDDVGVPTTANGKALIVKNADDLWVIDPQAEHFLKQATGKGYSDTQREILTKAATTLNKHNNTSKARAENMALFYKKDTPDDFKSRTKHPENSSFGILMDDAQLRTMEDLSLKDTQQRFEASMQNSGIDIPPSNERIALLSIYHQCPGCIGPNTKKYLKEGDREALTKEILTNMDSKKFKTRREEEAKLFNSKKENTNELHSANSFTEEQNKALDSGNRMASLLAGELMGGNVNTPAQQETHDNMRQVVGRVLMDLNPDFENSAVIAQRPDLLPNTALQGNDVDNELIFTNIKTQVQGEMDAMKKAGNTEDPAETIKRAVASNFGKIKLLSQTKAQPMTTVATLDDPFKNSLAETDEERRQRLAGSAYKIMPHNPWS